MTIYDIAKMAGVSASTVSRVLNGKAGCRAQKKEQILALSKQYNYAPDETARSLVKKQSHSIGILTDDLDSTHMNEAIAIIQNELLKSGYRCYISYVGKDKTSIDKGMQDLASYKVEGAMLLGLCFHNHKLVRESVAKYLKDKPVILVHQTQRIDMDNVYAIGASEDKGISECVARMKQRNRKNLLMIIECGRASCGELKRSFEAAVAGAKQLHCRVVTDVPYKGAEGEEAVYEILKQDLSVDGILCTHDRLAINSIYALQALGRFVPEDVSVIGEDNSELCNVCRPKLTSMDTRIKQTTLLSAQTMVGVLNGEQMEHHVLLDMQIVERDSL